MHHDDRGGFWWPPVALAVARGVAWPGGGGMAAPCRLPCAPAGCVAGPVPFLAPRRVVGVALRGVVLRALAAWRCAARVLAWSCSLCRPLGCLLAAPARLPVLLPFSSAAAACCQPLFLILSDHCIPE